LYLRVQLQHHLKIVPVHVKRQLTSGSVGNTQAVSGNSSLASADLTSALWTILPVGV